MANAVWLVQSSVPSCVSAVVWSYPQVEYLAKRVPKDRVLLVAGRAAHLQEKQALPDYQKSAADWFMLGVLPRCPPAPPLVVPRTRGQCGKEAGVAVGDAAGPCGVRADRRGPPQPDPALVLHMGVAFGEGCRESPAGLL